MVSIILLRFQLGSERSLIWTSWLVFRGLVGSAHSKEVMVDRLTKPAHFITVKSTYKAEDYVRLYIDEM